MDKAFIEELVALMRRTGLVELEYAEGGNRVKLRLPEAARSAAPANPGATPDEAKPEPGPVSGQILHRAGMAGVFYRAAEPGAEPYVSPQDTVAEGQTLALIEAMKMMVPVTAEAAGIVAEIHIDNGAAVAMGDALVTLKPVEAP